MQQTTARNCIAIPEGERSVFWWKKSDRRERASERKKEREREHDQQKCVQRIGFRKQIDWKARKLIMIHYAGNGGIETTVRCLKLDCSVVALAARHWHCNISLAHPMSARSMPLCPCPSSAISLDALTVHIQSVPISANKICLPATVSVSVLVSASVLSYLPFIRWYISIFFPLFFVSLSACARCLRYICYNCSPLFYWFRWMLFVCCATRMRKAKESGIERMGACSV